MSRTELDGKMIELCGSLNASRSHSLFRNWIFCDGLTDGKGKRFAEVATAESF